MGCEIRVFPAGLPGGKGGGGGGGGGKGATDCASIIGSAIESFPPSFFFFESFHLANGFADSIASAVTGSLFEPVRDLFLEGLGCDADADGCSGTSL